MWNRKGNGRKGMNRVGGLLFDVFKVYFVEFVHDAIVSDVIRWFLYVRFTEKVGTMELVYQFLSLLALNNAMREQ